MTGTEDIVVPAKAATKLAGQIPGELSAAACTTCQTGASRSSLHTRMPPPCSGFCSASCTCSTQAKLLPSTRPAGAWLVQFPGTGHGFIWERMDEVLAVMEAFLQAGSAEGQAAGSAEGQAAASSGGSGAAQGGPADGEL